MVASPGRKDSASASDMPGARPEAAAAGLTAASRRRPPAATTVANGVASADETCGNRLGAALADCFSWRLFRRRSRSIGQSGRKTYKIRRIGCLHIPCRRYPATTAQQLEPPARLADARFSRDICRRQGGDAPAGYRRTWPLPLGRRRCGVAPAPQNQSGDAGAFGGKLQTAARHHRQAADLPDHGGEAGAAQAFFDGPQNVVIARRPNDYEARRIEAVRRQPQPVKVGPLQAPQNGAIEAGQDAGGKAGWRSAVFLVAALTQDLVHGAQCQTAARQGAIDLGDAERQHAMPGCRRMLDPPNPIAQFRKCAARKGRRGGHISLNAGTDQCFLFVLINGDCQYPLVCPYDASWPTFRTSPARRAKPTRR